MGIDHFTVIIVPASHQMALQFYLLPMQCIDGNFKNSITIADSIGKGVKDRFLFFRSLCFNFKKFTLCYITVNTVKILVTF